ncbi:hypothetical protein TPS_04447 [Trichinella pseudospiralis]
MFTLGTSIGAVGYGLMGRVVLRFGNGLIGVDDAEGLRSGIDALCALGSQWYTYASCLEGRQSCGPGRARGERGNHTQLGRCLSQDKGLKGKQIFRQKSHRNSSPRATTDGQHPYDYKANGPSEATPTSEKRQQTLLEMQWSKPHQPKMPSFLCDARVSRVSTSNRAFPVVVIRYPEIETLIVKVGAICSWTVDPQELSHKILLGWDFMQYHGFTPDPRAGCLTMRQGNILFQKSHAVALVTAEPQQSELRDQLLAAQQGDPEI